MNKYYKLLTLSFALVLAIELDTYAATLPFAKGEHPRIIITKDEIPLIAAKVDEPTDLLYPRYMAMKRDVDAALSNNWDWEYIKGPSSGEAQARAVSAAFVYLIENYLHPESSSFYVNGVKQVLENTSPNSYTGYARQLKSFAVAYDWIYNGLLPQERITIGNKLMTSYAILEDPNNRGAGKWPLDDWHTMMSNMPSGEWTYAAIAIWNETDLKGNAGNSFAQDRLNQIRTFLTTKKIPFTNMVGGGINPDGGYDDIGGTRQFALELHTWDRATGENLWNTSGYLQANVITRLFAWRMYTDWWLPYGMFYDEDRAFSEQYPIEILSKKDTTGIAQDAANNLFKKGIQVDWYANWEQYRWIIFYDPFKPAANYNTLPLAYYAQGYNADGTTPTEGLDTGWVFFRSGWTKDDTLIAFTSGDWFTAKQVYDVNAFSIYRKGDLAIMNKQNQWTGGKDPVTGDQHNYSFQMNYGKPTVAVNSITVSDPNIAMDQGQELFQYGSVHPDNVHPNYVYYDQPGNPEHGDYVNEAINTQLASHSQGAKYFDRGDLKKFETKNSYDYTLGDGSKAYHPERLTNFQRALTFLDKKYLVILDRVSSAKPNFVKRWYLHTVKEPTIPGAPLADTSSQDGSTTWSQADFNNLHIDSDIATFSGGGRLFVKSLLPEGATYRKRGGEGFFFWRNDRSWNPELSSPADKSDSLFEGRKGWRLEQDISGQKDDIFLNVLFPTDATVASMPETVRISKADGNMPDANMVGAHLKDSAENKVVLFSSDPQGAIVNGSITYSVNLTANGKHFLFDLDLTLLSPILKYDIASVRTGTTQTITISPGSGNLSSGIAVLEHTDKGTLVFTTEILSLPRQTNHPPVLGPIGDKDADEGEELSFRLSATDLDGDVLTYSVINAPSSSSFNNSTGEFSLRPSFNQQGSYRPVFIVDDGKDETASEIITITVRDVLVNRPPIFNPISAQSIDEGKELKFIISATDPDGDSSLTYSANNLPLGASFNSATRVFSWTPDNSQSGIYPNIHFAVSDGRLTDFEDIAITVNDLVIPPLPVNHPPVANAGFDQTTKSGQLVQLDASASFDPDGDTFAYQWTQVSGQTVSLQNSNPAIASFTAPEVTSEQTLEFQLTVTGPGNLSSADRTIITVKPKPEEIKPTIQVTNPQDKSIVAPRSRIIITANLQDPGNLVKKVSFLINNKTYRASKNRQGWYSYNWTVPYGYSKTYIIQIHAQDKQRNIVANDSIAIFSSNAPRISLTNPQNSQTVLPRTSISVTANLSPNKIGITKVEFYINNQKKGAGRSFPYSYNWRVPRETNQIYNIQAKAFTRDENSNRDVLVGESEITVRVE